MSFFSSTVGVGVARSSAGLAKARWTHARVPRVVPAPSAVKLMVKLPPAMARASSSRQALPIPPQMSRGYASLAAQPRVQPQPKPTRPALRRASPSQTLAPVSRAGVPAAAAPKPTRPHHSAAGVVARPVRRRAAVPRFHPHLAPIAESGSGSVDAGAGAPARPPPPSHAIQLRDSEEAGGVALPAPGRRRSAVARFYPHLAPISELVSTRPPLRRAAPYDGQSHPAQL